jgi:hypothetical protein
MGKRRPQPRSHWSSRRASDASGGADAAGAADAANTTRARQGGEAAEAIEGRESPQAMRASTAAGPRRSAEGPRPPKEIAAVSRIGVCPVCGTEFDPSSYQVLVSALGRAPFDRIECADVALADRRRAQAELAEQRQRRRRRR